MKRVYFLRPAGKLGPIKIGCSESPKARARQIGSDRKEPIRLIADAPGTFTDEMRLHRQFADTRVEGEWFAATDELMAVIDHVIDTGSLPPPLEEDRAQVMIRLYLGGSTLLQIGQKFGMTRERVRQILRKHECPSLGHRVEHARKPQPVSAEEREFAALYTLGTPPRELSKLFPHLSRANVLRRTGTTPRGQGFWLRRPDHDERVAKVAALYKSGITVAVIARQVGLCAPEHVYYYLQKAGISASRRSGRRYSGAQVAQMIRAFHEGACIKHIADTFGASCITVRRALLRSGVTIDPEEMERRRISAVRAANFRRARQGSSPDRLAA